MSDIFIDTNIFIRFLTWDQPQKAKKIQETLRSQMNNNETNLFISDAVIMEIRWVLESFYGLSDKEIKERLLPIVELFSKIYPRKEFEWSNVFSKQLNKGIEFIDVVNYYLMKQEGVETILSCDTDFDNLKGIKRSEP